jgi:pimeloyl-ACP methyl ester carboxylesterase
MPTFRSAVADVRGSLPYLVGGEGRPVLYLHSAAGVTITPALEKLAQTFRLYAPTLPGFDGTLRLDGVASPRDLAGLVDDFAEQAIGERCDVIGHSLGGWVAAWLAALHPERVGQLVLAAPAGFRPEGVGGLNAPPGELRARMYAHPERAAGEKQASVLAQNRLTMGQYNPNQLSTDTELADRLPEIQCLTLIVQGTEDGITPPDSGRLLKKRIPSSYLCYVYDAAHNIEMDQPDRFASLVKEFLERAEAFIINWKENGNSGS